MKTADIMNPFALLERRRIMAYTLEISPNFTIEDIHKIRGYNYEVTKHMTVEEKLYYYNTPRTDAEEQIAKLRDKRNKNFSNVSTGRRLSKKQETETIEDTIQAPKISS